MRELIIAVDFDGCITKGQYGSPLEAQEGAKEALFELKSLGCDLILWTCRAETDNSLTEAIEFLKENQLYPLFSKINQGSDLSEYPESRKVLADIYIDDRNVGGWIGWEKSLEYVKKFLNNRGGSVIVEKDRNKIINQMCFEARHDFGLRISEEKKRLCPISSGMTEKEAKALFLQMEWILDSKVLKT